jgi:hypothetical protein
VLFQGTLVATQVLVPLLAGLALTALFVAHAQRSDHPLLEPCLFADRAFAAAAATTFVLGAALFGALIIVPPDYQGLRGEAAIATGLQRIGGSFGTAILTVVLTTQLEGAASPQAGADAFNLTFLIAAVVTMLGVVPAVVLARVERRARAGRLAAARAGTEADRAAAAGKGALA